jgi:hypothetical protein
MVRSATAQAAIDQRTLLLDMRVIFAAFRRVCGTCRPWRRKVPHGCYRSVSDPFDEFVW